MSNIDVNGHACSLPYRPGHRDYGQAVEYSFEDTDGWLWVTNDEYSSPVNYCPICGYKAKKQVGEPIKKIFE